MIGIKKISYGRMGNRLFQYHFLKQVAKKLDLPFFHPMLPDNIYFEEMEKKKGQFRLFKKTIHLNSKTILNYRPEDFLNLLKVHNAKGNDVVFDPPMLGEVFFDFLYYPPSDFIKIKKEYQKDFEFDRLDKTVIGLHFRGTDFKAWNEMASLKFDYYKKAIDYCLANLTNKKTVFVLFTDDYDFPTYLETLDYLKALNLEFHISDNKLPAIYDFYQLSQCDVIISSPSTFAVIAGSLGKQKKIIHNQAWLDYCAGNNDIFWVKLLNSNSPYYSLWKSF